MLNSTKSEIQNAPYEPNEAARKVCRLGAPVLGVNSKRRHVYGRACHLVWVM